MLSHWTPLGSRYNWCPGQDVVNREWEPGAEKRKKFFHLLSVIFERRETCHVAMESAAERDQAHRWWMESGLDYTQLRLQINRFNWLWQIPIRTTPKEYIHRYIGLVIWIQKGAMCAVSPGFLLSVRMMSSLQPVNMQLHVHRCIGVCITTLCMLRTADIKAYF